MQISNFVNLNDGADSLICQLTPVNFYSHFPEIKSFVSSLLNGHFSSCLIAH
nr:MAG TPA_asm: hypothetical protein [Caudoviricetes sp.]